VTGMLVIATVCVCPWWSQGTWWLVVSCVSIAVDCRVSAVVMVVCEHRCTSQERTSRSIAFVASVTI
jgi:hypothetical protein